MYKLPKLTLLPLRVFGLSDPLLKNKCTLPLQQRNLADTSQDADVFKHLYTAS